MRASSISDDWKNTITDSSRAKAKSPAGCFLDAWESGRKVTEKIRKAINLGGAVQLYVRQGLVVFYRLII